MSGIRLRDLRTCDVSERAVDGIFVAVGHRPVTELFRGHLEMDAAGYLVVRDRHMSSVDGVFVAGDVHDHVYRQAVTAAGFGAMPAIDAVRWLHQVESEPAARAA